jgi:hypothetical protein
MQDLKNLNLLCISESELIQWQARGRIHLATCRVISSGESKNAALFALAPCLRLEDAKGRIVVQLKNSWCDHSSNHPAFINTPVLSLPWDLIEAVGPTLKQFERRLEPYGLPLADWDISLMWDEWLFCQGRHERAATIAHELKKLRFNSSLALEDDSLIIELIGKAIRPKDACTPNSNLAIGWQILFEKRDQILNKLRFDGHADRLSFLEASINEILCINSINQSMPILKLGLENRESGWLFTDLTPEVIKLIIEISGEEALDMENSLRPLLGAIYLRLYDELHYGEKNWGLCFNLLRFAKYSINSNHADLLTFGILASFSAEELKEVNLVEKFNLITNDH